MSKQAANPRKLEFTQTGQVAYYLLNSEIGLHEKEKGQKLFDHDARKGATMPGVPLDCTGGELDAFEFVKTYNGKPMNTPSLVTNDVIVIYSKNDKWHVLSIVRQSEDLDSKCLTLFGSIYRAYGKVELLPVVVKAAEWDGSKVVEKDITVEKHIEVEGSGQLSLIDNIYSVLEFNGIRRENVLWPQLIAHIGSNTAGDLCKKRDAFFSVCVLKELSPELENRFVKIPFRDFIKLAQGTPFQGLKLAFNQDKLISPFIDHNPMINYFKTIEQLWAQYKNNKGVVIPFPKQEYEITCVVCFELAVNVKKCPKCKNIVCGLCYTYINRKCPHCRSFGDFNNDPLTEQMAEKFHPKEYLERTGSKPYFESNNF